MLCRLLPVLVPRRRRPEVSPRFVLRSVRVDALHIPTDLELFILLPVLAQRQGKRLMKLVPAFYFIPFVFAGTGTHGRFGLYNNDH